MPSVSFGMTGGPRMVKYLRTQERDTNRIVGAAIYQEAEEAMALSKDKFVPVISGFLRGSGYVHPPEPGPDGPQVEIGFTADYALYVHEAPPERGQGKNKFLSKALEQRKRGFDQRMSKRISKMLNG